MVLVVEGTCEVEFKFVEDVGGCCCQRSVNLGFCDRYSSMEIMLANDDDDVRMSW